MVTKGQIYCWEMKDHLGIPINDYYVLMCFNLTKVTQVGPEVRVHIGK